MVMADRIEPCLQTRNTQNESSQQLTVILPENSVKVRFKINAIGCFEKY